MNSLSWTIYAINVIDSLDSLLGFICITLLFLTIFLLFSLYIEYDDDDEGVDKVKRTIKISAITGITLATISVFIPSKTSMVMIAASEFGNKLMNEPSTKEVLDPGVELLKEWIRSETTKIKKEKK